MSKAVIALAAVFVVVGAVGLGVWRDRHARELPPGIARGNGRLEATEIDVGAKYGGRITEVLVYEGDDVVPGQPLLRIDTSEEQAQLQNIEAELKRARESLDYAGQMLRVARHDLELARNIFRRSSRLVEQAAVSAEKLDRDRTELSNAVARLDAAQSRIGEAEAGIDAVAAEKRRIESVMKESVLLAPKEARVLYKLSEPGEVLPRGGKALTLIDLNDVYMILYLGEAEAGQAAIGGEARIVLDALPDLPLPARLVFVSPKAQFTPKQVETSSERQKLMFRLKAQVDPEFLRAHRGLVKPGMPGVAYVKLSPEASWPPLHR
ncbi:HlyD family secretion protein [Methylococcus capsulatus]|uniref:HlyD family secretion protein n=1 Tax=Methylococcus capsulatus TaxID=414 RepID=UPI001C52A192|nr:efflux RND transporter periplasmic adaptor subunit [Methylococcus capsulatus]QXP88629.1 efflux RND transporter periplasmic adaptor subunit [Methylococcus capsulatus]QXP94338.1 efflux RND transporter periplasmic adaptor subunit [Methylococcus capsulatus]UQN10905.1 efflux RND transporter periplasmic adaptor subunit [Methylococcus capsulatus]